jgi:hypothetical protein
MYTAARCKESGKECDREGGSDENTDLSRAVAGALKRPNAAWAGDLGDLYPFTCTLLYPEFTISILNGNRVTTCGNGVYSTHIRHNEKVREKGREREKEKDTQKEKIIIIIKKGVEKNELLDISVRLEEFALLDGKFHFNSAIGPGNAAFIIHVGHFPNPPHYVFLLPTEEKCTGLKPKQPLYFTGVIAASSGVNYAVEDYGQYPWGRWCAFDQGTEGGGCDGGGAGIDQILKKNDRYVECGRETWLFKLDCFWPHPISIETVIIPVQLKLDEHGNYSIPAEQAKICADCLVGVEELESED